MSAADDRLNAIKADYLHICGRCDAGIGGCTCVGDPRGPLSETVAALRAVLDLHIRGEDSSQGYLPDGGYGYIEGPCLGCEAHDEYAVSWPCSTVRAIESALGGGAA